MSALLLAVLLSSSDASPANPCRSWSDAEPPWSSRDDRPAVVWISDPGCPACLAREEAVKAGNLSAAALREAHCARTDRWLRPDLDDFYGTGAEVLGAERAYPLLVAVDALGWPFAARPLVEASDLTAFVEHARTLWREDRAGVESAVARSREGLTRAQRPEPARHPLEPGDVERALDGLRDGPGSGAPRAPAAVLFALEHYARTGRADGLRAAVAALNRDDAGADAWPLAARALRLEALARAHAAAAQEAHRDRAIALAAGFRASVAPDGYPCAPGHDGVLLGWNALAVSALALSGQLLGHSADVDLARELAGRLLERFGPAQRLGRLPGNADVPALLEDHAFLARGLLDLHAATGDERWIGSARRVTDAAIGRFLDVADGGFFLTPESDAGLPVRLKSGYDTDTPSANGVMALVLLRLARATGERRYQELAVRTLQAFAGDLQRAPRGLEAVALAAGEWLGTPKAPPKAPTRFPDRAVRGPVRLEASLSSPRARQAGMLDAHVRLTIAPGWQIVARGAAADLMGLTLSAPGASGARVRYPPALRASGPWGSEPVAVYQDQVEVALSLRAPSRTPPEERRVHLRVVFQPCRALRCEPPESVELEVAVEPEGAR